MPPMSRRAAIAALAAAASAGALASPAAAAETASLVTATIRPEPSIRVARGGALTYRIDVRNRSKDPAIDLSITIPHDPQQLALQDSSFTAGGDWVSTRSAHETVVTFNRVRPSDGRSASVTFRVADALPDDTVIGPRCSYSWRRSDKGGGSGPINWAPVLVGGGSDSAPYVWASATPDSGPSGTVHRFFSDRFLPFEELSLWVNTPDGARAVTVHPRADSAGVVRTDVSSAGLRPGVYTLVMYGTSSGLAAVVAFIVR